MAATDNKSNSAGSKAHGANGSTFEENFTRLQEVVTKLSDGNLTLEEALSAYEEGMGLADHCAQMLEEAELRVKQVSERSMRAGTASLDELRRQPDDTNGHDMQGLVALEIDSFETPLVFDEPHAPKEVASRQEPAGKKPQSQQRPAAQPLLDELDPLFDDDE